MARAVGSPPNDMMTSVTRYVAGATSADLSG